MNCFTSKKNKYKKMFFKAFKELNESLLRIAIIALQDWDKEHNTKKFDKYLTKAIVEEKQSNRVEGRLLIRKIMNDFFEEESAIEIENEMKKRIDIKKAKIEALNLKQEEPTTKDIAIQKNPDLVEQKLNEIQKKKLDILYRKELIKEKKKMERKQRGRMG